MTPPFTAILRRSAGVLFEQIKVSPQHDHPLLFVALLLEHLAEDVDGYAASCLQQARCIRAIVQRACALMPPARRSAVEALVPHEPTTPEDYQNSHLDGYLSLMKRALIEAHAWLETHQAPGGDALLEEIWVYLESQALHESRHMGSMW